MLTNKARSVLTLSDNKQHRKITLSDNVLALYANRSPTADPTHNICQQAQPYVCYLFIKVLISFTIT